MIQSKMIMPEFDTPKIMSYRTSRKCDVLYFSGSRFLIAIYYYFHFQFPFAQSNIICMFLSFADLLLGLFLGLPTAIHLRFADYFSEQHPKVMVHYTRYRLIAGACAECNTDIPIMTKIFNFRDFIILVYPLH